MPAELGPCRNCGATVERSATRCRACGYEADPKWNEMCQFVFAVYGAMLVATVVLAPVGLVFLWKARLHHRALTRGVVEPETELSVRERVVSAVTVRPAPDRESSAQVPDRRWNADRSSQ